MPTMNRRQMIVSAAALVGGAHLPLQVAGQAPVEPSGPGAQAASLPTRPRNLLASTFTPELLSRSLAPVSVWRPFPTAADREPWRRVPQDIALGSIASAEAELGKEWPSLTAAVFLEYQRNGNRTHFEALNFGRRQRLISLVLGECFEGNGRFIDDIANGIWLICEETFWGVPAHLTLQKAGTGLPDVAEPVVDLFAAQTGATLAWIHYLLGSRLHQVSPLLSRRIEIETKRRILDPALERDDFWWMWKGSQGSGYRLNNWNPWINSNWLAANLLLEQDPERRIQAASKICRSLDAYIASYSADGACDEGPGYWSVSAGALFDCLSLLASATGGAANALSNPFIKRMMRYIVDVHIAGPYSVNYGDAAAKAGLPGLFGYLIGSAIGDRGLQAFGAHNVPPPEKEKATGGWKETVPESMSRSLPEFFHAAEARSAEKADALVRDAWYPDLALMTARSREGSSDGFYLAVQAAQNLRSHGHNDSGSFIVFHDGEPVFIDVGVEAYTAKTFSAERYSIWTMQSAYHNLPTVGGIMQSAASPSYRAAVLDYSASDTQAALSLNLAPAYPPEAGIARWIRILSLDRKGGSVLLSEDFQLHRASPVALSFMTPRIPSLGPRGSVVLSANSKSIRDVSLQYDPALAVPSFERIEIKDAHLRDAWGDTIYRVLLTSTAPVASGFWRLRIA